MLFEEKTMKSEKIYDGKMINLRIDTVELPDKKYSKREVVEHPGSVAIIALTEENEVLLVEQYRKSVEKTLLELPAGKIEIDEEPSETAKREFEEETGYELESLEYLLEFYSSPGFTDERVYLFLAKNIKKVSDQVGVDNEKIALKKMDYEELLTGIKRGQLMDSKTVLGMLYAEQFIRG